MKPTKEDRARLAKAAVNTFAAETKMDTAGEELETVITNLFAGIMYLLNQKGIYFEQVLNSGQLHFETELVEEADELEMKA